MFNKETKISELKRGDLIALKYPIRFCNTDGSLKFIVDKGTKLKCLGMKKNQMFEDKPKWIYLKTLKNEKGICNPIALINGFDKL